MNRELARSVLDRFLAQPFARLLQRIGFTPNAVTVTGLLLSFGVAYLLARGLFLAGGALLLGASALDLLDGTLARLSGKVSKFGAVLDSTSDRLSEAAVFFGLLIFFTRDSSTLGAGLTLLALVFSFMVSYLRARGEGLGIKTSVGLATRPERVIILAVGLMIDQAVAALAIVAALSFFTSGQRLFHIWKATRE